jgi:phosphomannomutase / phosphoglucomutase
MKFPSEIFRQYDIRGIVGPDLTPELAYHLGRAVGSWVKRGGGTKVVLGRDCRPSGEDFSAELGRGLRESGVHSIDIGVVPTPVVYWAIEHLDADGSIAITGSHNPAEYNGFKLTLLGRSLFGEDIQKLRLSIENEDYESGEATHQTTPVVDAYLDELVENLKPVERKLKVVVDAGNGVGGITALPLFERMGCEVIPLYCELDGTFPNHHADPTVEENLADLKRSVLGHGADLGLAFDGDADRIGVVDRNGEVIWGDKLMILLSRALLKEEPGAVIIGEVKCSKTLYDDIAAHGGKPIMWITGHSLIKAKMKEEKAALAGEMSGHIFYKHRYYGFDDAAYASGRLLEIMGSTNASVSELLADVPKTVSTPELRMDCPENIKFDLVKRVIGSFQERAKSEPFSVIDIDGARVEWEDGWGLVRCSNTQPILVLRFEAQNETRLKEIRKVVESEIELQRAEMN